MNIQAEKLEIMKMILETENPGILKSIKKIFKKETHSDFWESLSENQKNEIKEGINEADNGEVMDYEVFMKKHRK
jgi:hypothetical protein